MRIDFNCSICNTKLFSIASQTIETVQEHEKGYQILCQECYREKDIDELTKIASISSDLVIKDLARIKRPKKEELI